MRDSNYIANLLNEVIELVGYESWTMDTTAVPFIENFSVYRFLDYVSIIYFKRYLEIESYLNAARDIDLMEYSTQPITMITLEADPSFQDMTKVIDKYLQSNRS